MLKRILNFKTLANYLVGLGMVLLCVYTLYPIRNILGNNVVVVSGVIAFCGGYNFSNSFQWLVNEKRIKFNLIVLVTLSLYYSVSIIAVKELQKSLYNIFTLSLVKNVVLTCIWVFPAVLVLFKIFACRSLGLTRWTDKSKKKTLVCIGILLSLEFILLIVALNPTITVMMSYSSLFNARHLGEEVIYDWVSPFYFILLRLIINIVDSVTFIALIQYLLFILVYLKGIAYLIEKGIGAKWIAAITAYIMLNISLQMMLLTVMPDSLYLSFMLWLTILMAKIVDTKGEILNKYIFLLEVVFVATFVALLRQNGMLIAVACTIAITLLHFKRNKKCVIVPLLLLLIIACVKGPIYKSIRVEEQPQFKFLALTNDILNSYYSGQELDKDTLRLVNNVTCYKPEDYSYTQFKALYNTDGYNMEALKDYSTGEFLKIYIVNFIRNPKSVMTAVLCRTQQIWSVAHPRGAFTVIIQPFNYRGDTEEEILLSGIPERKNNIGTRIVERVFDWTTNVESVTYKVFWRGNFLYNVLLFAFGVFILNFNGEKKEKWYCLLCLLPIILSVFTLLVGGGWPDYRYHVPAIVIVPFLSLYLMRNKSGLIGRDL